MLAALAAPEVLKLIMYVVLAAGGLGIALYVRHRIRKGAITEQTAKNQAKEIKDAQDRIAIDNRIQKETPDQIARDLGAGGTGELR